MITRWCTVQLEVRDLEKLKTGALFRACAVEHEICDEILTLVEHEATEHARRPELRALDDFDDDDIVVSLGFVMKGLPATEVRPVGDEFATSLRLVEQALGKPIRGVMPLAGANVNALVPFMVASQLGIPVADADPMGRVFPLLSQTSFAVRGVSIGPIAVTVSTGETVLLDVTDPERGERLVRSLAAESGGWAATASYPVTVRQLRAHGVVGSVSRLLRIGGILEGSGRPELKLRTLHDQEDIRRSWRARVVDVAGRSRPVSPLLADHPTSVTLLEEGTGRQIRLEIQNEILMAMVDGAIQAVVPDIITLTFPSTGKPAALVDLVPGNTLDVLAMPADPIWYSPEGHAIAGPEAFSMSLQGSREETLR